MLAAKSGATYVSVFIGRLDDDGYDGLALLDEIINIYDVQGYQTRVLAASLRSRQHLTQAATLGAAAATVSPQVFCQCFDHPLTARGLEIFEKDWKNKQ